VSLLYLASCVAGAAGPFLAALWCYASYTEHAAIYCTMEPDSDLDAMEHSDNHAIASSTIEDLPDDLQA